MSTDKLNIPNEDKNHLQLQISIEAITQDIENVTNQIQALEDVLRQHLTEYIIEAQELTVLYKLQKKAKKEKRLAQKRKGKTYLPPKGLLPKQENNQPEEKVDFKTTSLKKRLYREAMLQVHPDKFSLSPNEQASATDITAQLIHIYKHDDIKALQDFHSEIFSEGFKKPSNSKAAISPLLDQTKVLHLKLKQLEKELAELKTSELYKVIITYEKPLHFVDELIICYKDKIAKLKKRTRTKN